MKLLESKKRTEVQPESYENLLDSVPTHRKTRDLPNLTECHACGFKVDVCSGKNRLRTLYSEWRVVLLCRNCFSSVQSSQICSYCFYGMSLESYRCNKCQRSVHKNCFLKYKNVPPWSYASMDSEFSVCVDCWIPKHLELSRRRKRRVLGGENGRITVENGSSRVLPDENLERSMEDLVEDAKRVVGEKVEAAARAREGAMKKALVAKRAVEIANNALGLVASKEKSGLNPPPERDAFEVLDCSELTFELHPQFNCLPRISKSCCLLNTCSLDIPKMFSSSVDSSGNTSNSMNADYRDKHVLSCDNKLLADTCKSLCEPLDSVGSLDSGSSTGLNLLCTGRSGMETGSKVDEPTAESDGEGVGEGLQKEGEGSCSDRIINMSEDTGMELDRKQADSALHREKPCNAQPDRYFLKYSRRNCSLKSN
ncbi:hypothetical protein LR48_Vigan09g265900 [Vigna angularis]|uniref:Uncharacterized protein n=1 Tax=Phaseolus angularis TaxID=3914 RepID=A0A0L9VG32_PHAAN|nr:hypothetical protein LR48_Vigan09g265900 [Vigna angularis]